MHDSELRRLLRALESNLASRIDNMESRLAETLNSILRKERQIMALEDDILNDVAEQTTVIDGLEVLLTNLADEIKKAGTDKIKLDAIEQKLRGNTKRIADDILANTPVVTPPVTPTP